MNRILRAACVVALFLAVAPPARASTAIYTTYTCDVATITTRAGGGVRVNCGVFPPPTPAPTVAPATPAPTPAPTPLPTPTATPTAAGYFAPPGTAPYATGPFVAPVSASPNIVANSSSMLAQVLVDNVMGKLQFSTDNHDNNVPIYVSHQSDPSYTIHCMYYSGCPLEGSNVPIPKGALPEGNLGFTVFTDDGHDDQHLAVRNADTGIESDLWLSPTPSGNGGALNIGYGGMFSLVSGGIGSGGATAAGFALSQGRVRAVDLLAGRIPYALFLVTPCEGTSYVAPANGQDSGGVAGCPPMGSHVWLDSSPADIAASGAAPDFQVILRAMHEFGGYIGDRCTNCTLTVALEGGLTYTSFGLTSPWARIAALHPTEVPSGGVYHILVSPGNIDLRTHLHIISP